MIRSVRSDSMKQREPSSGLVHNVKVGCRKKVQPQNLWVTFDTNLQYCQHFADDFRQNTRLRSAAQKRMPTIPSPARPNSIEKLSGLLNLWVKGLSHSGQSRSHGASVACALLILRLRAGDRFCEPLHWCGGLAGQSTPRGK